MHPYLTRSQYEANYAIPGDQPGRHAGAGGGTQYPVLGSGDQQVQHFRSVGVLRRVRFWGLVQTKKEPPKCPEQDCFVPKGEAQYRWTSLSRQYCSAHAEVVRLENHIKSLKEEMRDAQSKLVAMMGNYAHADYAGVKLSRYMMAGTVDYKQLATDKLGELDEQVLAAYRKSPQERLRISTNKPDQPVETPIKISLEQENLVLPGDSPSSFYF
jgi:hypothetical protein